MSSTDDITPEVKPRRGERRNHWQSYDESLFFHQMAAHLDAAPEWETRIETMERHFDRLISRLDGMTTVWRASFGIIVAVIAAFAGALTWYANERNSDLNQLATATNRLATIAEVLTTKQDRDEVDKADLRRRIEVIESREHQR